MATPSDDAHASYATAAGQWASQVQAFRQSVSLYREVGILRARRRRNARDAAPPAQVRPSHALSATPTTSRSTLRLLPANEQPGGVPTTMPTCPLTRRQIEVVELIADGMTNSQIARELVLTPGTVANHIEHILRRLDVPNRAAAATWLARERPRLVGRSTERISQAPDRN